MDNNMLELLALSTLLSFAVGGLYSITYQLSIASSPDISTTETTTYTGDGKVAANPTCPPAAAGTLSTRTSATAGVVTSAGHSFIVGQRVDITWTVGGVFGWAYGAIVSAVGANTITFSGLAGDALPIATSSVTIAKAQVADFALDGDNIVSLVVMNNAQIGIAVFATNSANIHAVLVESGDPFWWNTDSQDANPLAGTNPTKIWMSSMKTSGNDTGLKAQAITDLTGTGSS